LLSAVNEGGKKCRKFLFKAVCFIFHVRYCWCM
jgi:hypothetical protein